MRYHIHGKNIEVTKGIEEHFETKISKLDKYFTQELEASVVVKVYPHFHKIEITIPTKHYTLRIEEKHDDLYTAIDHAVDKLERQIRKNKTRLTKHLHDKSLHEFELNYDDVEEDDDEIVVKTKKLTLKPIDIEEAILQMELINHDFYVYHDVDIDAISVLYRRKDGSFGILETK